MRQPQSIYCRYAAISAKTFKVRAIRKLNKWIKPEDKNTKRKRRQRRPTISLGEIDAVLTELGIKKGDNVMVHSGISHVGKIKGGASGLLDLLQRKIGKNGVLLFPVFPFNTLMLQYLETRLAFDARTSPSKMGTLTEVALKAPDRIRSVHPTHSVAGFGKEAGYYLNEHYQDNTPFGPHSPFWRLAENNGKILVIGVGLGSVTSFHLTEDRMGEQFPVRVYLDNMFEITCFSDRGEKYQVRTSCHDPFISKVRDCYLVEEDFISKGIYKKIELGNHYLGIIAAADMDKRLQKLAKKNFTIYGRIWG
jgi:aminoglycoside 3-N-acetyltransferase